MSWEKAMLEEQALTQIKEDHLISAVSLRALHQPRNLGGTFMYDRGYMRGFWDAVGWLLHMQSEYESLTTGEALAELRKGRGSIYWPLKADDPTIWADCPRDGRVTVGVEGYCDSCGFPFDGMPPISEDKK